MPGSGFTSECKPRVSFTRNSFRFWLSCSRLAGDYTPTAARSLCPPFLAMHGRWMKYHTTDDVHRVVVFGFMEYTCTDCSLPSTMYHLCTNRTCLLAATSQIMSECALTATQGHGSRASASSLMTHSCMKSGTTASACSAFCTLQNQTPWVAYFPVNPCCLSVALSLPFLRALTQCLPWIRSYVYWFLAVGMQCHPLLCLLLNI